MHVYTHIRYARTHNNVVLCLYRALTRIEWFSKAHFSKLLKQFCSKLLLYTWQRHQGSLVFRSETGVTGLSHIHSSIQLEKDQEMGERVELEDEEFVAKT